MSNEFSLLRQPESNDSFIIPKHRIPRGLYWIRYSSEDGVPIVYPTSKEDLQEYFYTFHNSDLNSVMDFGINEEFLSGRFSPPDDCGGMSTTERNFLYEMVKSIGPKNVIEFSPNRGRSTYTISKALLDVGIVPSVFDTHELMQHFADETNEYLKKHGIDFVTVKQGDVFQTLDREKLKDVDFLFIDSDHSGPFTKRYIDEFFPLLKKGCWVAVHDIRFHQFYVTGETAELSKYINERSPKSFFHLSDVLKYFGMTTKFDDFNHCAPNTLFFFQVP